MTPIRSTSRSTSALSRTRHTSALSRRTLFSSLALLPAVGLAACSGEDNPAASASDGGGDAADSGSEGVTVTDPWVKAADSDMTGAFMILHNAGSTDLELTAAHCDRAGMVELHEVTDGTMRAVEGGLPLPAGGDLRLEPGGYHVMLMDLQGALKPGEDLPLTLEFSDGSRIDVDAVVKDYAGAQEDYAPGHDSSDDGGAEGHDMHDQDDMHDHGHGASDGGH